MFDFTGRAYECFGRVLRGIIWVVISKSILASGVILG
jgi:hypothetical protein